jgi:predicted transcriptional regulator/DNA-binding XRE family transcriptional regulator
MAGSPGVPALGRKIRALRLRARLGQAALAARLGVSPSYLNLIEHGSRPVTTTLLLALSRELDVDLRALASGVDALLLADLVEAFGDPVFEDHPFTRRELQELAESSPDVGRAIVRLHGAYVSARSALDALAERMEDGAGVPLDREPLPSEQVYDFLQRRDNHIPVLEDAAALVWREGRLDPHDLAGGLQRHLATAWGVTTRIATAAEMGGVVRRYDPVRRELTISEALRVESRGFQLAAQAGLLGAAELLTELTASPELVTEEGRALARVALAGYFAGAVMMPYATFLEAAERDRYDVELLEQRFGTGWEQVCHRLTTLRRPGAEGVSFYFVRVDLAGNISKKLSAGGIHFPRYSGLCPLWNVHAAFLQPGRVRVQVSRLPDGRTVLAIARTVRRQVGGYQAPEALYAVGIGCDRADAHRVVYGDGMDMGSTAAVPIGITCRLCDRTDCTARAFPSLHMPLRVDPNIRGASAFMTAE